MRSFDAFLCRAVTAAAATVILTIAGISGCGDEDNGTGSDDDNNPPRGTGRQIWYTYNLVNEFPHDPEAFTEGLEFADTFLYEGTGREGHSTIRQVDVTTGQVVQSNPIPNRPEGGLYFGESIAILGDRVFQQTWTDSVGFIWDLATLDSVGHFSYESNSWGLTSDGSRFIMSNGSPYLFFRDTATFELIDSILVRDSAGAVNRLDELEFVNGEIWASRWFHSEVARINPANGWVNGYVELGGLLDSTFYYGENESEKCLSGIAYDSLGNRLFITGKYWPKLFEVEVVERE